MVVILLPFMLPFLSLFTSEKGRIRTGGAAGADPLGGEGRYISPGDGLFAGSIGRMVTTLFLILILKYTIPVPQCRDKY
jgi:hypothetical protein